MINNIELYRIFRTVARCKQFSAAAKELCVSQPAVSQAVKLLEEQLSCTLFVRTSKGAQLTAEGAILYNHIDRAFGEIERGEHLVAQMCDMEQGEICIGASDMTLQFYLLPILEQFHIKYPHIKIQVTNAPTPETMEALEAGNIDFGVISTPVEAREGIEIVPVHTIRDIFVAGTAFLELKHHVLTFEELTRYPLVCLEKNTSTRRFWDSYFAEHKIEITPEFELATSDMIVQFALRNLGIGLVMEAFAEPYLKNGMLFELMFDKKPPERNMCLAVRKNYLGSTATKNFLAMMNVKS